MVIQTVSKEGGDESSLAVASVDSSMEGGRFISMLGQSPLPLCTRSFSPGGCDKPLSHRKWRRRSSNILAMRATVRFIHSCFLRVSSSLGDL